MDTGICLGSECTPAVRSDVHRLMALALGQTARPGLPAHLLVWATQDPATDRWLQVREDGAW